MKAVICTKYGAPDVLTLKEVDKPVPKANEILIKIYATTVSVADTRVRAFRIPISFWLPARLMFGLFKPRKKILGLELSGKIEAVGENVNLFKVGDEVFACTGSIMGSYAEYICLPEKSTKAAIGKIPKNINMNAAAALSLGGATALYFLKKANIQPSQRVLIYGASGSVGTYAVQIAKYYGAHITAVCSTKNIQLVKSLGASEVVDYKKDDFSEKATTYDVIFDTVGKTNFINCMKVLANNGKYLQAVAEPALAFRMILASLFSKRLMVGGTASPNNEELDFLKGLVEKGIIKPVLDRVYPIEEIVLAHEYVDTHRKKGNVVMAV